MPKTGKMTKRDINTGQKCQGNRVVGNQSIGNANPARAMLPGKNR
jgi:hypothetical protein